MKLSELKKGERFRVMLNGMDVLSAPMVLQVSDIRTATATYLDGPYKGGSTTLGTDLEVVRVDRRGNPIVEKKGEVARG